MAGRTGERFVFAKATNRLGCSVEPAEEVEPVEDDRPLTLAGGLPVLATGSSKCREAKRDGVGRWSGQLPGEPVEIFGEPVDHLQGFGVLHDRHFNSLRKPNNVANPKA